MHLHNVMAISKDSGVNKPGTPTPLLRLRYKDFQFLTNVHLIPHLIDLRVKEMTFRQHLSKFGLTKM